MARAHDGTLHRHYIRELPDFDNSENQKAVAQTILSLLRGEANYTFPSNKSADYYSGMRTPLEMGGLPNQAVKICECPTAPHPLDGRPRRHCAVDQQLS